MHAQMLSHFNCVWLFSNPMDCSLPGSSIHGILQARILEWVALPSFKGSSWPSPALAARLFNTSATCEAHFVLYCNVIFFFLQMTQIPQPCEYVKVKSLTKKFTKYFQISTIFMLSFHFDIEGAKDVVEGVDDWYSFFF